MGESGQLSEEKLEPINLENFKSKGRSSTRTKNEEELSKNVQDLTARQVSFEERGSSSSMETAKAERNALYALARNENAKAHKQNFVTDTKDIESERYMRNTRRCATTCQNSMQRKVKLAQTACGPNAIALKSQRRNRPALLNWASTLVSWKSSKMSEKKKRLRLLQHRARVEKVEWA